MNKMAIMVQRAENANNLLKLILITYFVVFSCAKSNNANEDLQILQSYIHNLNSNNKEHLLYLDKNNSNELVLDRYEKYIKSRDVEADSIIQIIFSEDEYDNYKNQTIKKGEWDIDFNKFEGVIVDSGEMKNRNHRCVSKPIYTKDKKYALIYSLLKGRNDVYFMPSIEVFFKEKDDWRKIYTVPTRNFN
jgi:hypothetical protein